MAALNTVGNEPEHKYSSFQTIDLWSHRGDTRKDSAAILFQFFFPLQVAIVSSSGMGMDVHSLMLSIQHSLCHQWCHPLYKVPTRMVLELLSWCVTCLNHVNFRQWASGCKNIIVQYSDGKVYKPVLH